METSITPKKRTLGEFKKFGSRKFPIDCDGLNDMQTNEALLSILGKIGGSQYIISGCIKTNGTWSEGYIFTATTLFPEGELLYVEAGTPDDIYIQSDPETITASGSDYDGAYLKRYCKHGANTGTTPDAFNLANFTQVQTNKQLHDRVTQLENTVITPEAVGTIKMWPNSTNMPSEGWALCDGSTLNKNIYPNLFLVIGYTFSPNNTGDSFNLPDMRSRFPVAFNPNDGDFNQVGKNSTSKEFTLGTNNVPVRDHRHHIAADDVRGATDAETIGRFTGVARAKINRGSLNYELSYAGLADNGSGLGLTSNAVGTDGNQMNNSVSPVKYLPPYFTIPFIIKIK